MPDKPTQKGSEYKTVASGRWFPLRPGFASVETEIRAETLTTLGHRGGTAESALAALATAGEGEKEALLQAAADEVWAYFVQREMSGMTDHSAIIEEMHIPQEVLSRMGTVKHLAPGVERVPESVVIRSSDGRTWMGRVLPVDNAGFGVDIPTFHHGELGLSVGRMSVPYVGTLAAGPDVEKTTEDVAVENIFNDLLRSADAVTSKIDAVLAAIESDRNKTSNPGSEDRPRKGK